MDRVSRLLGLAVLGIVIPSCGSDSSSPISDGGPPAAIATLKAIGVTSTTVTLHWIATGDDGSSGTATSYELRYATTPITAGTWASATPVAGVPAPAAAGIPQTWTVAGLAVPTRYHFALVVADEVPNVSGLSNVAEADVTFQPGVAFIADKDTLGVNELYVADLAGTDVRKLSGTLVANGDVLGFAWSPDRSQVAFVADKEADGVQELYVVSAWGGAPIKASEALAPNVWVVASPRWSPDGSRIAYRATHNLSGMFELFVSPWTGSSTVKVSGTILTGGDVWGASWAPDSTQLVYLGDLTRAGKMDLYVAAADGASNVQVSPPFPGGEEVGGFSYSPDGSRIAFTASLGLNLPSDVYAVLPDGTGLVKTTGPFQPAARLFNMTWSPDSQRLAFYSDMVVDDQYELYVVNPLVAASQLKVSGTLGGGGYVQEFAWSPDSSELAFQAWQNVPGQQDLFVAKADGSGRLQLSAPATGPVWYWEWSPDGSRIAFIQVADVYTALPDGTGRVKISGTMAAGGAATWLGSAWSPDGSRVCYLADQEIDTRSDLYTSAPTSSAGNVRVSRIPVAGGDVKTLTHVWTSDGLKIVFMGDLDTDGKDEIYSTDPTGSAGNVKISGTMVGGVFGSFQVR